MSAHGSGGSSKEGLLKDLHKQVAGLEDDLWARSESVEKYREELKAEYAKAFEAGRTGVPYQSWRDERVMQVAGAWVLGCVFVRFCEDNGLIARPWLAGVGERLKDAEDHDAEFFVANPAKNDRDWIIAAFDHLAGTNPTVAGLFDRVHNPLWQIEPSYEAATKLLKFWRRVGADGEIIHSFVDKDLDTRFLGDLYQDLSEHARKTYALLQTPRFVERFILDLTLEPAVAEFGLEPVVEISTSNGEVRELPSRLRTIDPACGSGHFLLGMFERLLKKWQEKDNRADDWILIRRALESVHGCDKNPLAVSIARFRLLVTVLKHAEKSPEKRRLDALGQFPINIAVADSLLHGRDPGRGHNTLPEEGHSNREPFLYRTEDISTFVERCDLLGRGSYHVVVGNPPYITVKDKKENQNYRAQCDTCAGTYALSVPFAQRIFELAVPATQLERAAGFTGQITANSFMKREFGRKLIDWFHKEVELTRIIDTSGAYIPGHGTPTVILVGRNRVAHEDEPIRAVLGIRGEPSRPKIPAEGIVWSAITYQHDRPGSESEWVSVEDSHRRKFTRHPWSLEGGGAGTLQAVLEKGGRELENNSQSIGFGAVTRADDAYFLGEGALRRANVPATLSRPMASGENIRDWSITAPQTVLWPYDVDDPELAAKSTPDVDRLLWPNRSILRERVAYGRTQLERNLALFEYSMFFAHRFGGKTLSFACVATHNHVVLDRDNRLFNRHAPVIKLPASATEDEHLALLGVLNSSTACFWLKQVCQAKGGSGLGRGHQDEEWEERYEFTGTKLLRFPLPSQLRLPLGRTLDALAHELSAHEPSEVCTATESPTRARLDAAHTAWIHTRQRMIALQEELDWEIYHSYGLLTEAEKTRLTTPTPATIPHVKLGERAFEIVLARKQAAGKAETVWFDRHNSTPVTEIPTHWPEWYRDIVESRIDTIANRRDLALIESPECKRRWAAVPWDKREKTALRTWLLDRCEDRSLWFHVLNGFVQPRALTISRLADELERLPDAGAILNVAHMYATHLGKPNLSLAQVLTDMVDDEHVPFLAAYRYKNTGLHKRAQWENVWEQQREEDRTEERLDIPAPPKYTSADFSRRSYWSNRGKLDIPKERFVSYPDANPDSDPSLLLGWAGWDQRDQATALLNLVSDRRKQQGWPIERLIPLLAGIAELTPWLRQWFGEVDEKWGEESAAEEFQSFLDSELAGAQLTPATLATWRPVKKTHGNRATGTATNMTPRDMSEAVENDD